MSNNSKKNLLNESQIRQFMKLASLEPLAAGFVHGLAETRNGSPPPGLDSARRGHGRGTGPEDRLEEEADAEALEDYAAGDLERGHPEEAEDDELEADAELDDEGDADARMVSVDDFLAALERALEDAMGEEVEIDDEAMGDDDMELDAELDMGDEDVDVDIEDDEMLAEDKPYTAKREKPGADKRKGAEKRGAEATKLKHDEPGGRGHKKGDDAFVNEDEAYTSKREKPGADKRKGAEKRGAEATKLKHDEPGGRGHKKGDDAYVNEEQGADDREDEHLGMEDGPERDKKQSMKDRRKEMRGARRAAGEAGDPVPHQESLRGSDELVEQITKRVAARILKSALRKR